MTFYMKWSNCYPSRERHWCTLLHPQWRYFYWTLCKVLKLSIVFKNKRKLHPQELLEAISGFFFFLRSIYFFLKREEVRGKERERNGYDRETWMGWFLHAPNPGPGPQPRNEPWPAIKLETFQFMGQHPTPKLHQSGQEFQFFKSKWVKWVHNSIHMQTDNTSPGNSLECHNKIFNKIKETSKYQAQIISLKIFMPQFLYTKTKQFKIQRFISLFRSHTTCSLGGKWFAHTFHFFHLLLCSFIFLFQLTDLLVIL